jgi:hypothetical protein
VADSAGGHEAQAVLLAHVVEFNCCCHCVILFISFLKDNLCQL